MRRAPAPVNVATVVLYLYVFMGALIGLFALMAAARPRTDASEDRELVVFAAVSLAVAALVAVLAHQLVAGRRWALVILLVLLWANAAQAIFRGNTGFLNLGAAVLITALVLVPRRSRAHFAKRSDTGGGAPTTSQAIR